MLGLTLASGPTDDPMMFEVGSGTSLLVTEMPDRAPAGYASISFMVTGIEQLVQELKQRGVTFLAPGSSSFRGQAGVAGAEITDYGSVKSTWFLDSEGNILAMNEIVT